MASYVRRAEYFNAVLDGRDDKTRNMVDLPKRYLNKAESKKGKYDGGEKHILRYKFNRHSTPTRHQTGYEEIAYDFNPILEDGEEGIADVVQPAGISGHEERIIDAKGKLVDLFEDRDEDVTLHLKSALQDALISGSTGAFADIVPLDGETYGDGILQDALRASQTNTVHGISRASVSTLNLMLNFYRDLGGSFSLNGLDALYEAVIECEDLTQDMVKNGQKAGDIMIWSGKDPLRFLKRAVGTREQYLSTSELDAGKKVLMYSGYPVQPLDLPNDWSFALVDHDLVKLYTKEKYYFQKSPIFDLLPAGFDVMIKLTRVMCQQMSLGAGTSGLLDNGNSW